LGALSPKRINSQRGNKKENFGFVDKRGRFLKGELLKKEGKNI